MRVRLDLQVLAVAGETVEDKPQTEEAESQVEEHARSAVPTSQIDASDRDEDFRGRIRSRDQCLHHLRRISLGSIGRFRGPGSYYRWCGRFLFIPTIGREFSAGHQLLV